MLSLTYGRKAVRSLIAFVAGALCCFVVLHLFEHRSAPLRVERPSAEIPAPANSKEQSAPQTQWPVSTGTDMPVKKAQSSLERPNAADHVRTSGHVATTAPTAPHEKNPDAGRPAAELTANMIANVGDAVMGRPLVAPHETLQAESKDENWSPQAQQELQDYFSGNLGTRFEFPVIDCRLDLCELQAATTTAEATTDVEDFNTLLRQLHDQAWWSTLQFDNQNCAFGAAGDRRGLIVCFFTRNGG